MQRRDFVSGIFAGSAAYGLPRDGWAGQEASARESSKLQPGELQAGESQTGSVTIERPAAGQPHSGKVLAAIQPHADDIPFFAAGTVAKLISEGYSGCLIRMTNDDKTGPGTVAEGELNNEKDNAAVAKALGLTKVFNLQYTNHEMDGDSRLEIRERLIYLIRMMKIDTVISYDPWGAYEENPDHYVTAQMVEAACWIAGMAKDYPEQLDAGLQPHGVKEKYYFARGPQRVNRVVDIAPWIDRKVEANLANIAQGAGGDHGARLRARLAAQKLRLPILGEGDDSANRGYIKNIVLDYDSLYQRGVPSDRVVGGKYGLEWAEAFHYIGPTESLLEGYIHQNAVAL
jgi:LmbE family N-acetylglucosaminyl deacetylase